MHSLTKKFEMKYTYEDNSFNLILTCLRIENDNNGNPIYKIQLWTDYGNYYPSLVSIRQRKDCSYHLQSYNIMNDLKWFVNNLEKSASLKLIREYDSI